MVNAEALLRVAQRVDHARAEAVHSWIVDKLNAFGTNTVASDGPDSVRHTGDGWGHGLALLGDAIIAIHEHDDARATVLLARPAQWLTLALWTMLSPASDATRNWLNSWAPTDDPGVLMRRRDGTARLLSLESLVDRLFPEGTTSHRMLSDALRGDGDRRSGLWALVHLACLTGAVLHLQEHDAPSDWTKALRVTAALCTDLNPEILGEA